MQFQVNGQDYFLHFVQDEHRWYVIEPCETGFQKIPVYVDEMKKNSSEEMVM